MMAQIGVAMSDIHLYFDIRHNCDGRIVSCTRVQHFTCREINKGSFRVRGWMHPRDTEL